MTEKPRKKTGRPKGSGAFVLDDKQKELVEQLARVGCNLDQIAGVLGVDPKTLDNIIERDPSVSSAISKGRANGINKVAQTAYQMAISGKIPAMTMFFLKTRARWAEARDIDPNEENVNTEFKLSYSDK
jgi:hypothetical protein